MNQSTVKQVPLALKPEISDLIGEPIVAVRLNVSELSRKIEIKGIQVELEHDKGRQTDIIYRFQPPTVNITVEVPEGMVNKAGGLKDLFEARVNPESFRPGMSSLAVVVNGPPETKILGVKPDKVNLEIKETQKLKIKP